MSGTSFPNESEAYRHKRDELLEAEIALREQIESVAELRRGLPLGGEAENYQFLDENGPVSLEDLFGDHDTLIIYSYMFAEDSDPCPMCSAFMDSVVGQLHHIAQRVSFVVAARSSVPRIQKLVVPRGWGEIRWVSASENSYPVDYKSEMPNGAQVPMCNVFVKREGRIHHFWNAEMFFAQSEFHPRHIDMLWPLWHIFDITPEGRGEFIPGLKHS
ncbi:MAG: DUF899 domain-containing protein [Pseudomonadales bacterium]|nr:DUF899 domain-containing protein [Pseudomonadales bacterium]